MNYRFDFAKIAVNEIVGSDEADKPSHSPGDVNRSLSGE